MSKVNPVKYYNIQEVMEFFPWIHSLPMTARWVETDRNTNNYLKAVINGRGTGKRYYILGENIIKYLAQADEQGLVQIPKKGVIKMADEETNVDEVNKEISEAQAEEVAEGVDKTDEVENADAAHADEDPAN